MRLPPLVQHTWDSPGSAPQGGQFGFVYDHSKVVALQIVIGNVFHAYQCRGDRKILKDILERTVEAAGILIDAVIIGVQERMNYQIIERRNTSFRGILRTPQGSTVLIAVEKMPISPVDSLGLATNARHGHPAEPQEGGVGVGPRIYIGQQYDSATSQANVVSRRNDVMVLLGASHRFSELERPGSCRRQQASLSSKTVQQE